MRDVPCGKFTSHSALKKREILEGPFKGISRGFEKLFDLAAEHCVLFVAIFNLCQLISLGACSLLVPGLTRQPLSTKDSNSLEMAAATCDSLALFEGGLNA
ncbi:hypothetical protein [Mesorhizobium sp. CN2-181]|uniref:hypothetical protein n=1 Tax=Mesorhizobium yinganensis TaxID=3157707 RepID=UPI0032B76FBD